MMIKTGIDILKIDRIITKAQNEQFIINTFTDAEISYSKKRSSNVSENKKYQTLAGIYCAKEAVLKALGVGIEKLEYLKQIELTHESSGRPKVCVSGNVLSIIQEMGIENIDISISHDGDYAIASCVLN